MTGARDQQGYDYGAGSGYQSPYGRVNQNDDFGRPSLDDAWGVPASASGGSYNAARDRYVARKELAAGAGGAGMMNFSKPSKSRMWWWVGGLMGIIILAGVIAGVVVATRGGGSSSSGKESTGVVKSDPSDPSNFVKDPALHQSFCEFRFGRVRVEGIEGFAKGRRGETENRSTIGKKFVSSR